MKKRSLWLMVPLLILSLIAAACGGGGGNTPAAPGPTPKPLKKVVMLSGFSGAPVFSLAPQVSLALALGYWRDEGLDVEVKNTGGLSGQVAALVAEGFGTTAALDPTTLMAAVEQGQKVKAAYVYIRDPFNFVWVVDDSPIKDIKELAGKKIGAYSAVGSPINEGKFILKSAGVDPSGVSFANIGFGPATDEALKKGDVAAYVVTEADSFETRGLKLRRLDAPAYKDMFGLSFIFSEKVMNEEPDVVAGLLRGVAKATLFALTNPQAAAQLHWKIYPASKPTGVDDAKAISDTVFGAKGRFAKYNPSGRADARWGAGSVQAWQAMQQLALDAGIIKQSRDIGAYWDDKYLAQANNFDQNAVINQAKNFVVK